MAFHDTWVGQLVSGQHNLDEQTAKQEATIAADKKVKDDAKAKAAAIASGETAAKNAQIALEAQQKAAAIEKERAAAAASTKAQAEAEERVKQVKLIDEANEYGKVAQATPEMQAAMEQQKKMASGELSYAGAMGQRLSDKATKEQMALAYARGYDPNAIRGAQQSSVEIQAGIAQQVTEAKIKEQQVAQQGYLQALQYQQQISFSAEQAKKAYLMGNKELAQNQQIATSKLQQDMIISQMQNQTQLEQIRASITNTNTQAAAQKAESEGKYKASILGGLATAGAAIVDTFWGD